MNTGKANFHFRQGKDELCRVIGVSLPCRCISWFWDHVRTLSFIQKYRRGKGEKPHPAILVECVNAHTSETFSGDCAHAPEIQHML